MADMNEPLKPINTSFYDFERLVTGGFVYVDKTAQIYELAKPTADGLYYLPRPRRFGKSLMISTLKALFQGRRDLKLQMFTGPHEYRLWYNKTQVKKGERNES